MMDRRRQIVVLMVFHLLVSCIVGATSFTSTLPLEPIMHLNVAFAQNWNYQRYLFEMKGLQSTLRDADKSLKDCNWEDVPGQLQKMIVDTIQSGSIFPHGNFKDSIIPLCISHILQAKVNQEQNPVFCHSLIELLRSERFSKENERNKETICLMLLKMLDDKEYRPFVREITNALLGYFESPQFYSSEGKKHLEQLCLLSYPKENCMILLLPLILLQKTTTEFFSERFWESIKNSANAFNPQKREWRHFFSLLVINNSSYGNEYYLKKLEDAIMFEIGERIKIAEKRTSFTWEKFPSYIVWLSLVKPQKSVPILGKVLKEKSHTDEGSDVIPRYQGPAYYSACALALLLKGFPVYGNKAFYKENGQNKCIEWFEGKQHVKYTFFCIYDEIKIESLYQVDEQDLSIIDELRDDTFF